MNGSEFTVGCVWMKVTLRLNNPQKGSSTGTPIITNGDFQSHVFFPSKLNRPCPSFLQQFCIRNNNISTEAEKTLLNT